MTRPIGLPAFTYNFFAALRESRKPIKQLAAGARVSRAPAERPYPPRKFCSVERADGCAYDQFRLKIEYIVQASHCSDSERALGAATGQRERLARAHLHVDDLCHLAARIGRNDLVAY